MGMWHDSRSYLSVMKSIRFHTSFAWSLMSGALIVLGGLLAGCAGERPTAPGRSWEEIRYHVAQGVTGSDYRDVLVQASGELEWETQEEQGASTRGLLAGENLETLTRLIDALPPAGFSGAERCESHFFLSVYRQGEHLTYEGDLCDPSLPVALRAIVEGMESWIEDVNPQRTDPVPFRVLSTGASGSAIAGHVMAANVDELASLVTKVVSDPVVLPRVDFAREFVVAVLLGPRSTGGHVITVTGAFRTETGRTMLDETIVEPGPSCVVSQGVTNAYVLLAIEGRPSQDLLFRVDTKQAECGP